LVIDSYQIGQFDVLIVPLLEARRTKHLAIGKGLLEKLRAAHCVELGPNYQRIDRNNGFDGRK
jgi:hypothetical protein